MATAEFSKFAGILSVALSQHHLSEFEIAQLELSQFQALEGVPFLQQYGGNFFSYLCFNPQFMPTYIFILSSNTPVMVKDTSSNLKAALLFIFL